MEKKEEKSQSLMGRVSFLSSGILLQQFLPVGTGRYAKVFTEEDGEAAGIAKAAGRGDLLDVLFRICQHVSSMRILACRFGKVSALSCMNHNLHFDIS